MNTKAGSLFVHEKVSPTAFAQQLMGEPAPTLFDDFNGLPPDAAWSCYTHQGNWSNRIIKGHSEDVMASLAGKEDLAGKVQMIYWIRPTGSGSTPATSRTPGSAPEGRLPRQRRRRRFGTPIGTGFIRTSTRFYRTAAFGRMLLTESGSFFLQISSENLHRCALVLDEVFGAENRVATIAFKKSGSTSANTLPEVNDWLLWYSPAKERLKFRQPYEALTRSERSRR